MSESAREAPRMSPMRDLLITLFLLTFFRSVAYNHLPLLDAFSERHLKSVITRLRPTVMLQ
jgi:hypothetical protein